MLLIPTVLITSDTDPRARELIGGVPRVGMSSRLIARQVTNAASALSASWATRWERGAAFHGSAAPTARVPNSKMTGMTTDRVVQ